MLTNRAKLRRQAGRRADFLLRSDSFWTLKNKSPTPSQGLQLRLLEKDVKQAWEGIGAFIPWINSFIHSFIHSFTQPAMLSE